MGISVYSNSGTSTTDATGFWEHYPATLVQMADREVLTLYFEGEVDKLNAQLDNCIVGSKYKVPGMTDEASSIFQSNYCITGTNLSRKKGGLGILQVQYTYYYKREIWNIDFAEISKDIKTWLVRDYTDSTKVPQSIWNEYLKLQLWENNRTNETWKDWTEFKYPPLVDSSGNQTFSGGTLTGDTLKVAQKIMNGVTSYSIFTPIITRTTVNAISPQIGGINKIEKPKSRSGWSGFNNEPLDANWVAMAKEWLKTAERSSSNMDGSFTLVEQWTGMDRVDPDLYEQSNQAQT